MRFEKQFNECVLLDETGKKEIKVTANAEIILSVNEAKEILRTLTDMNDCASLLRKTTEAAENFIKENSDEESINISS